MTPTSHRILLSLVSVLLIILGASAVDFNNSLTSPPEGAVVAAGSVVSIEWTSLQGSLVSIWLRRAETSGFPVIRAVAQNITNTGSFAWTLSREIPEATYFFETFTGDGKLAYNTDYGPKFRVSSNAKFTTIRRRIADTTMSASFTAQIDTTPTSSAAESLTISPGSPANSSTTASSPPPASGVGAVAIIVISVMVAVILMAGAVLLLSRYCSISNRNSGYKPIITGAKATPPLPKKKVEMKVHPGKEGLKMMKSIYYRAPGAEYGDVHSEPPPPPYRVAQAPSDTKPKRVPRVAYELMGDSTETLCELPGVSTPDLNKELPLPPDWTIGR